MRRSLNPSISIEHLTQHPAPLEVSIRMQNRIQISRIPHPAVLDLLQTLLIPCLKHLVTSDMIPLLADVVSHFLQHNPVRDACALQQRDQVIRVEGPVRAPVILPRSCRCIGEESLTIVGRIAAATLVAVAADVAVGVADVVQVVLLEPVSYTHLTLPTKRIV